MSFLISLWVVKTVLQLFVYMEEWWVHYALLMEAQSQAASPVVGNNARFDSKWTPSGCVTPHCFSAPGCLAPALAIPSQSVTLRLQIVDLQVCVRFFSGLWEQELWEGCMGREWPLSVWLSFIVPCLLNSFPSAWITGVGKEICWLTKTLNQGVESKFPFP